jgi:hypothetical protein
MFAPARAFVSALPRRAAGDPVARRFRLGCLLIAALALVLLDLRADAPWSAVRAVALPYAAGIGMVTLIGLVAHFIFARLRDKAQSGDAAAWVQVYLHGLPWRDVLAALAAVTVTISAFTAYKSAVVGAAGYHHDALFIAADRALFGTDAWRLTHAVLHSAGATAVLDFLYHPAFMPMLIGFAACAALRGRPALRYTYMLSYMTSFVIVGMVGADLCASAGPVYDGLLFGDGRTFGQLTALLRAQSAEAGPFMAVMAQDYLLQAHRAGVTQLGSGISAMPSMHVVMAFLWVLPAWHIGRALGLVVTGYALVIWLASVHLGWHYFSDGLVGLAVLCVIWSVAGWAMGLYGTRSGQSARPA